MIRTQVSCCCAEGELEVSQGDKILGIIGAGKAFGELAVLYNCQRTASIRGQLAIYVMTIIKIRIRKNSSSRSNNKECSAVCFFAK